MKRLQKVMVWGCFSWRGTGGLEFLKKVEMMNGVRSINCLMTSWNSSWASMAPAIFSRAGPLPPVKDCDGLVPPEAPHPVGEVARQLPQTQSHQDRLGGDEELHKPPAVEGGDLEGVA
jgi:hypothetical protein